MSKYRNIKRALVLIAEPIREEWGGEKELNRFKGMDPIPDDLDEEEGAQEWMDYALKRNPNIYKNDPNKLVEDAARELDTSDVWMDDRDHWVWDLAIDMLGMYGLIG